MLSKCTCLSSMRPVWPSVRVSLASLLCSPIIVISSAARIFQSHRQHWLWIFKTTWQGYLSNHIVTYTQDYADHSPYLSRYASKLTPILPPVELPVPRLRLFRLLPSEHHVEERQTCHRHGGALRCRKGSGDPAGCDACDIEEISKGASLFAGTAIKT